MMREPARVTGGGLRGIVRPDETVDAEERELPGEVFDYLAPERFKPSATATATSDLFAWGCLLWHLLTGRPPWTGATPGCEEASGTKVSDSRRAKSGAGDIAGVGVADRGLHSVESNGATGVKFAELAEALGPSTRQGKTLLAQCVQRTGRGSGHG